MGIKRVVDYAVKVRIQPDKAGIKSKSLKGRLSQKTTDY